MAFSFLNILKTKKAKVPTEPIPKIEYKGGTKFAENSASDVYLDFEELGGFPYIKTVIIGAFSTKIKRTGCTLSFIFENDLLTLNSDKTHIESTKIKNTNVYYTEIDFELNETEATKIKNTTLIEIQYTFKNNVVSFKPI